MLVEQSVQSQIATRKGPNQQIPEHSLSRTYSRVGEAVSSLPAIKEGGNLRRCVCDALLASRRELASRRAGRGLRWKAFTRMFLWGRGVAGDLFEVAPMPPQAEVAEAVLVRRSLGPSTSVNKLPHTLSKAVERLPAVNMPLPKTGSLFKDGD